ncbi:uncharacterized protein VICG_00122 [Vittaforma corneae ATCC 50505]|uniref:60S ribosomal protein L20 n=1 Tax=Vittaforma corneae (strain ATCC 50505) TaxID=993615 RepID=L2GR56_VITCO|nr:uncharacterized protein VICG_00122 [Vittaforma corneae ATCC 50505]ELA42807.1 hypothetical protein VICG_00122 [Vittaforma corneae ATCC 50505]
MMFMFSKQNYSKCNLKEFKVVGCKNPSEKEPQPQLFTSNIFAENSVVAKSKFSKLLKDQFKIKATNTVIVRLEEIEQDNDFEVKNYGIRFTYRTRTGLCNAYKEVRHINRVLAVQDLYTEFGSKHKLKKHEFYIIEVKQLADDEVTKSRVLPYVGKDVKFPVFFKQSNTDAEVVPVSTNIFN